MSYSVELSRVIVAKPKPNPHAPRGLDRNAILDAAFALYEEGGEAGFSVRKLGARLGVDPMTVLHHAGSKDAILRGIADRALSGIEIREPDGCWKDALMAVADAYRRRAHESPSVFRLHFRYRATGPEDHASSEIVYRAMLDAGLSKSEAAAIGLSYFAFVLGFAFAEIEGLIKPLAGEELDRMTAIDADHFPSKLSLVPAFRKLDPDRAFAETMTAFIEGIGVKGNAPGTMPPRRHRTQARRSAGI
ncbi:MAG: TetR/AcrR family transcriptional regulator [Hyphomicrobium sp.]|nr:TetR/AcrR family transcriptional regulator [Hyphomicrobium sp.]